MPPKLLIITDLVAMPHLWMQMLMLSEMEIHVDDHTLVNDDLSVADLAEYDLILLNLQQGVRHRIRICKQLRAQYANPLLVMLPEKNEDLMLCAYAAGADDVLVQPLDNRLLIAMVNAWLRRAKMSTQS